MNTRGFLGSRPADQTPAAVKQAGAPAGKKVAEGSGEGSGEGSVIGKGLVIKGDVESTGALKVEGILKGDIDCKRLTVTEGGRVEGDIRADAVVIYGEVTGNIQGRSVMLYATARVSADIRHQGIGIEMGTRYDGHLKWIDDSELKKTAH